MLIRKKPVLKLHGSAQPGGVAAKHSGLWSH
jgi:hypothetical protein